MEAKKTIRLKNLDSKVMMKTMRDQLAVLRDLIRDYDRWETLKWEAETNGSYDNCNEHMEKDLDKMKDALYPILLQIDANDMRVNFDEVHMIQKTKIKQYIDERAPYAKK